MPKEYIDYDFCGRVLVLAAEMKIIVGYDEDSIHEVIRAKYYDQNYFEKVHNNPAQATCRAVLGLARHLVEEMALKQN